MANTNDNEIYHYSIVTTNVQLYRVNNREVRRRVFGNDGKSDGEIVNPN